MCDYSTQYNTPQVFNTLSHIQSWMSNTDPRYLRPAAGVCSRFMPSLIQYFPRSRSTSYEAHIHFDSSGDLKAHLCPELILSYSRVSPSYMRAGAAGILAPKMILHVCCPRARTATQNQVLMTASRVLYVVLEMLSRRSISFAYVGNRRILLLWSFIHRLDICPRSRGHILGLDHSWVRLLDWNVKWGFSERGTFLISADRRCYYSVRSERSLAISVDEPRQWISPPSLQKRAQREACSMTSVWGKTKLE